MTITLTKYDLLSLIADRIIYHRDGGDEYETQYWEEVQEALIKDRLVITGYVRNEAIFGCS